MNYQHLIDSPFAGGSGFSEHHFRLLGVYREGTASGNDHIYVTYHRYEPEEDCVWFVLSWLELENGLLVTGWETLFRGTPCMRSMIGPERGSQRFHIRQTTGVAMTSIGDNELLFPVDDYGYDGMIDRGDLLWNDMMWNTLWVGIYIVHIIKTL